jgi:hypothetical protein
VIPAHDDNGRNHATGDREKQAGENDHAPFNADQVPLAAIAATVDLGAQKRVKEPLPELSAAPLHIIRLTVGTLHV